MVEEKREEARSYDLRIGGPDEPSIPVSVEVEVRSGAAAGEVGSDGSGRRRARELELTPQVAVESPAGEVYFVAWNHVARTFALWLTRDPTRASGGESEEEARPDSPTAGDDGEARSRSITIDDAGEHE